MATFEYHKDRRIALYPEYLDAGLTIQEGRRVPKKVACEHPTAKEMADCCVHLKLPVEVQDKMFSRSCTKNGRIRVQLKDEAGNLVNSDIPNKKVLMKEICALIPKHAGRQGHAGTQKGSGSGASAQPGAKGKKKR